MTQTSSRRGLQRPMLLTLVLGSLTGLAWSQSTVPSDRTADMPSSQEKPEAVRSDEFVNGQSSSSTIEASAKTSYAPALDGTGLIAMDALRRVSFSLGATASSGWDSNPQDLDKGNPSGIYNVSPYFGLQASTDRTQLLIQYQPTISHYSGYAGAVMQVASAKFIESMTPRWTLTASTSGSHGQDSIRFLAPNQSSSIGAVAGTSTNAASYLPNAGTVTDIDGLLEVVGSISARRSVRLQVSDFYSSIPSLNETNSVATAKMIYEYSLSPTLTLQAYQRSSQYYGTISCTTFGAGAGLRWQPRDNVFFSASGGPQLDTPVCKAQQGFSYNLSFSTKVLQSAEVYFETAREPVAGYLGPGLWQDSITAGYERQIKRSSLLRFDVGFVHSNSLFKVNSYQGTYWDTTYAYKLQHGPSFSVSYRSYSGDTGNTHFKRSITMVAVSWTPNTRNRFR